MYRPASGKWHARGYEPKPSRAAGYQLSSNGIALYNIDRCSISKATAIFDTSKKEEMHETASFRNLLARYIATH
jgi:hypothetical protein